MNFLKSTLASFLGALFAGLLLLFLLIFIVGGLLAPQKPGLGIQDQAFLQLDLSKSIREKADPSPFRSAGMLSFPELGSVNGLYEIRQALREAAEDERIAGLYLRTNQTQSSWATLSALRDELVQFKSSGKPIYAWSDGHTEGSYYLASTAEHLYLHPVGSLELNGFAANPYYLRGLFDKIGIEPKIYRVGTYKSFIEPYKDYAMSDASREQTSALLGDLWGEFTKGVSSNRTSLSESKLNSLAASANSLVSPQFSLANNLFDGLKYEHEVRKEMSEAIDLDSESDLELVSLDKYLEATAPQPASNSSEKQLAVVFMEGDIVDGKGERGEIGGDKYSALLRKLRYDDEVKAVVLRINSPGGSALASDLIWAEIEALKKDKPVIASMGDVAASGGYYIAAPCNRIFARTNTITGSIGVFSMAFSTEKLMEEKLGVSFDRVVTHPLADMGDPNHPSSEAEDAIWQTGVENTYGRFIDLVRQGRSFPDSNSVDSIAQGRVWSGVRALDLGLIDEIGGLEDAIAYAANEADLVDYQRSLFPKATGGLGEWLEALGPMQTKSALLPPEAITELKRLRSQRENHWKPGVYTLMPIAFDIR